jgi:hypothetical protein
MPALRLPSRRLTEKDFYKTKDVSVKKKHVQYNMNLFKTFRKVSLIFFSFFTLYKRMKLVPLYMVTNVWRVLCTTNISLITAIQSQ